MVTKQEVRNYLHKIQWISCEIRNCKAELEQLREDMYSVSGAYSSEERVQSSRNLHKLENAVIRYVDDELAKEIEGTIKRLTRERYEIIQTIKKLEPAEYNVLHNVYVQGKDLTEVETIMNRSYSWVTSKHGTALSNLRIILEDKKNRYGKY